MRSRSLVALAFALLPFGCSSSGSPEKHVADAALDGAFGATKDGGTSQEVTCGGEKCTLPIGGGIERLKTCCTDSGGCGLKLPNVDKCLPRDLPGSPLAPECPASTFTTPGGDVLAKCCGPNGCGALDPFLGCVPNPDLGGKAQACTYDPTNDCSALVGVSCDGSEDCPQGKRCCGKLQGTGYVEFGCFDSCAALSDGGSPFRWLELCHPAEGCENPSFTCRGSSILPPPLTRCDAFGGSDPDPNADTSAGHVNCGQSVCGADEKCCIRSPHAPYCAKTSEPCECHPQSLDGGPASHGDGGRVHRGDAGHPDSGTDASDASN